MSYPESANVSAGDATLAAHYNNLRADAVHLGQAAADSVALGSLLERYESRLEIERLSTDKVRVPASASAPVSLLIDGYLCQAVANVDLDAGDVPAGAAAAYYIFANRADDSTTFTLTVNTSLTEAADQRRIGRFYWDGSAIVKDSVRTEHAGLIADLLYFVDPQICSGRLTLSTLVPVTVSDISSSATVYFTPYLGNRVALYVKDYGWRMYSFSELTLDISGIDSGKIIDVWLYDNAGTLTLAYTEWSNDTLRATAIVLQDGILVKSGSPSYRYLGSVRMSGAGVSADTLLKRFVFNYNNRVPRLFFLRDATASWTYNTNVWRQARATAANKVEFLIGVSEDLVRVLYSMSVDVSNNGTSCIANIGIGLDSITALASDAKEGRAGYIGTHAELVSTYAGFPGIGYHYLAAIEMADAASPSFIGAEFMLWKGFINA